MQKFVRIIARVELLNIKNSPSAHAAALQAAVLQCDRDRRPLTLCIHFNQAAFIDNALEALARMLHAKTFHGEHFRRQSRFALPAE
jgi:hypothetical protein